MPQDSRTIKRRIGLIITLVVNLAIVVYIAISEFGRNAQSVEKVSIRDIRLWYIFFGIVCFGIAVFMDYMKYRKALMFAEGKHDPRGAAECALLGKYYDNITPFGAGGQPFQIHYLKKRGYSTGTSAAAPAIGFLTQQFAFVLIGTIVFIVNHDVMDSLPIVNITAYVGLVMYALLPIALILFVVFPKPFRSIIRAIVRFGGKLHIIKDVDATIERWLASFDEYKRCITLFGRHPLVFTKLIVYSCIYQAAILSIPFFMIRAFGGTGDWWTIFSLVVYIYAAITIVPTPGNAGAAEGSFYAVFSSLNGGMLFWAMIGWRLLVYYSWLLCGLIVIARQTVSAKPRYKQPPKDKPMRVALFSDIFYPAVDGVVRTVDAYARHINSAGDYACVVCPQQLDEKEDRTFTYDVYRVHSFHFPGISFSIPIGLMTKELRHAFKENPPDVLHVHSPFFAGRLALRLGRKYHVPVVATFHSKYYDDCMNITHSRLLSKLFVSIIVNFFIMADHVWACSCRTADTLRSYGYNGRIHIMENGIETAEIPEDIVPIEPRVVSKYGLPKGKRTLLYVGQLIWQKNLRLILDTMKLLTQKGEDYCLVVAGSGYNGDEIESYSKQLGLSDNVHFIGKIMDRELLFGLFSHCDLFFFPSLYDNAPLVLREAAIAGLPSLLSAGSNSAEVVEDGFNGFTAEPNAESMSEKIHAVFEEGRLKTVGEKAKETIPISWDDIVERALLSYRTDCRKGHEHTLGTLFGE